MQDLCLLSHLLVSYILKLSFQILTSHRVVYSQFSGNFVSQAAQMNGHGIPNDLMQNFDPIAILFFAPIMDRLIYPLLQKHHIKFRPIARITFGFIVASFSMMYAA